MALLERFRTHPREKHPDPAVRLAYVNEIPLDDQQAVAAMAREDTDPKVRRAAVGKLMDPAVLGEIARDDGDETVRAAAVSMLRDLAMEAFEGTDESAGIAAVDALGDAKMLALVAKSARESVALRALGRIADVHVLG